MEREIEQPRSLTARPAELEPPKVDDLLIRWALSLSPAERLDEGRRQTDREWQLAEAAGVDDWDEWVRRSGHAALVWQRKD
jgi:hypothetical protein